LQSAKVRKNESGKLMSAAAQCLQKSETLFYCFCCCTLLEAEAAKINTRAGKNSDKQPCKREGIAQLAGKNPRLTVAQTPTAILVDKLKLLMSAESSALAPTLATPMWKLA
jgi:hypothetical protein